MENETLQRLFGEGWLPAPRESDEDFEIRRQATLRFCEELKEAREIEGLPFQAERWATLQDLKGALTRTEKFFGMKPEWAPVFWSRKRLPLWQGAALWILTLEKPPVAVGAIQLRGGYTTTELAAHELVHLPRLAFPEGKYEEFFTYHTSTSRLRRWIGPLFSHGWEAALFLAFSMGHTSDWCLALFAAHSCSAGNGIFVAGSTPYLAASAAPTVLEAVGGADLTPVESCLLFGR